MTIYSQIAQEGAIVDLSQRTQLRLRGADRVRYLNGQVTNDVRKLKADRALYACVTTAKGKLFADVFISAEADALRIDADPSVGETLPLRLERYIISDDVSLEDISGRLGLLHFIGPIAATVSGVASNRFGVEGIDVSGSPQAIAELLAQAKVPVLDESMQEVLRIEHGVPRWGCELDENTLPAEAGLDQTAIDFHKGCYIGQEVISRIKSVGHVNRILRGFIANEALQSGMALFDSEGRRVGQLTSATQSFALARPIALGYLKRGVTESVLQARLNEGGPGIQVEVSDLPFGVSR